MIAGVVTITYDRKTGKRLEIVDTDTTQIDESFEDSLIKTLVREFIEAQSQPCL